MGVKGDDILLAGVNEGTESPNKAAKAAKRTFAAGLDLQCLKKSKLPPAKKEASKAAKHPLRPPRTYFPYRCQSFPHKDIT